MRKKVSEKELQERMTLLGPPFLQEALYDALNHHSLASRPNRPKALASFEKRLGNSPELQMKYLIQLIYIGKELQEMCMECDRYRSVDIKRIRKIVNPWDHPALKTVPKPKSALDLLDSETALAWGSALADFLQLLRFHIQDFITTYQLRLLNDFVPGFPSRE